MHDKRVPFGAALDLEDAPYADAVGECAEPVDRLSWQDGEVTVCSCFSGFPWRFGEVCHLVCRMR